MFSRLEAEGTIGYLKAPIVLISNHYDLDLPPGLRL